MSYHNFEELRLNFETKIYQDFDTLYQQEILYTNKNLNIIHINIRNLTKNSFELLQIYLEKLMKKLDIIVLTEINCKEE